MSGTDRSEKTTRAKRRDTISRRSFVKETAAVAALSAAGPSVFGRRRAGDTDELKLGLIGCGGRGTGAVVQALRADSAVVLTAVADVFAERMEGCLGRVRDAMGEEAAQKVRVPIAARFAGFGGYQQVIDSGVDVVVLTTPPHFRPEHIEAAIDGGTHVFTEKPMAVDSPGVARVLAATRRAKDKNLAVVAGFCWRYGDAERAVFKQLDDGAIGDVVTVHTTYHTGTLSARPRQPGWSDMEWQLRNWWHFTWLSGDHIAEQACHSIDRLAWATGDRTPARAIALGGRAAREGAESGHVYDHFAVIYEYDDGMRCFHTCRQIDGCPSDNSDYVYGTEGSCVVNGWIPRHEIMDRAGRVVWSYEGPRRDMYQTEHDELFASIRSGAPINDGEWMCRSTLMAIMGRMAAYTGQTVSWEQAVTSEQRLGPAKYAFGDLDVPPVAVPGKTKLPPVASESPA